MNNMNSTASVGLEVVGLEVLVFVRVSNTFAPFFFAGRKNYGDRAALFNRSHI